VSESESCHKTVSSLVRVPAMIAILLVVSLSLLIPANSAFAQATADQNGIDSEAGTIATSDVPVDGDIEQRIRSIYSQIDALSAVEVTVRDGVVFLSGSVANETQAARAIALATRLEGVVTVDDGINRSLDIEGNVRPLVEQFRSDVTRWMQALPLLVLALTVFLLVAYTGHRLAGWNSLWRRLSPNPFLGELLGQAVRIAAIVLGLILALNLLSATALIGTILGGAGVVGLAIGFAVRDSLENYISSIMLSIRQPFRANDHVVIGDHEGKVIRLTSRATILMTLDGNQLRIPNSMVFKAVILNYTTNPERRFDFELGVDADDDPVAAMKLGMEALSKLPFVLNDPEPNALIRTVGDSNIVISFMAWIDQRESDFGKSRSLAIRAVTLVLEEQGFTLPEPIYRLRFDPQQAENASMPAGAVADSVATGSSANQIAASDEPGDMDAILDVSPDTHLEEKVNEERAMNAEEDLLDDDRPVE
jgi:small conductance mechanosensitive channel